MANLRGVLIFLISSLIIIIFTSCSKNEFNTNSSNAEIADGIESFINRGVIGKVKIELKDEINIDNLKIISFSTYDQNYGYAVLERMGNDLYKINSASFCKDVFDQSVIKTKNGKYLLSVRSNHNIDIKFIRENPELFKLPLLFFP